MRIIIINKEINYSEYIDDINNLIVFKYFLIILKDLITKKNLKNINTSEYF